MALSFAKAIDERGLLLADGSPTYKVIMTRTDNQGSRSAVVAVDLTNDQARALIQSLQMVDYYCIKSVLRLPYPTKEQT